MNLKKHITSTQRDFFLEKFFFFHLADDDGGVESSLKIKKGLDGCFLINFDSWEGYGACREKMKKQIWEEV
jgi:hypothetical protein